MKKKQKCPSVQKRKQVELKAYELWKQAGSPMGRDQEFWYNAEIILKNLKTPKVKY